MSGPAPGRQARASKNEKGGKGPWARLKLVRSGPIKRNNPLAGGFSPESLAQSLPHWQKPFRPRVRQASSIEFLKLSIEACIAMFKS